MGKDSGVLLLPGSSSADSGSWLSGSPYRNQLRKKTGSELEEWKEPDQIPTTAVGRR